jgi:hypothetical protein
VITFFFIFSHYHDFLLLLFQAMDLLVSFASLSPDASLSLSALSVTINRGCKSFLVHFYPFRVFGVIR